MDHRATLHVTDLEQQVMDALDVLGVEYRFQHPTRTGYLIDFALPGSKIALEVDGPYHDEKEQKKRHRFRNYQLRREGWSTVRLHHAQLVEKCTEDVAELIEALLS
ncbi:MAG: endonuclease domain-containing protein [Dehalococcoidia bacterium]